MSSTGEGHCSKGRCGAQVEHAVGHVTVPTTSTHQTLAGLPGLVLGDTTYEQSKPVTMVTIPSLSTIGYPVIVSIQTEGHPIKVTTGLPTPPLQLKCSSTGPLLHRGTYLLALQPCLQTQVGQKSRV